MELYVENRFINLISGLEAMHRRKSAETEAPKALADKITRILDQVRSSNDKKWLERQLAHAHEPKLQERLFDVFNTLPLGLAQEALREFCAECAKKRNDMAHFGGDRHAGDYQDFMLDLSKKSDALSYLYHAVLLLEIGIDADILNVHVYRGFRSTLIRHAFVDVGLLPKSVLNRSDSPGA